MGVSSCRRASLLRLCGKQRAARRIATVCGENAHNSLRHAAVALPARHLNIITIMEMPVLCVCLLIDTTHAIDSSAYVQLQIVSVDFFIKKK